MTDAPKIEFPQENYPIRVIADSGESLLEEVVAIVRRHDQSLRQDAVEVVKSREGAYSSVRLSILATGEEQLQALHRELLEHPLVRMVL